LMKVARVNSSGLFSLPNRKSQKAFSQARARENTALLPIWDLTRLTGAPDFYPDQDMHSSMLSSHQYYRALFCGGPRKDSAMVCFVNVKVWTELSIPSSIALTWN